MLLHSVFYKYLFILLSTLFLTTGCGHGYQRIDQNHALHETGESYDSVSMEQMSFEEFCTTVFQKELAETDTLNLHYTLLHPKAYGITPGEVTLGTISLEDMVQNHTRIREIKSKLTAFDYNKLTADQQLTYDALLETLNTTLLSEGLELYDQPLASTIGIQAQLPILLAEYSFHSTQDIEDYLSLLCQIDRYYGELLEFEQQKTAAGLGPSDATIDAIIQSCESYLIDPNQNFLSETFEARIADLEADTGQSLTSEQKNDLATRHTAVIRDHFIPAYQALIDGLSALKGHGINDGGLANFKHGKSYYEYLLKCGPGLSYTVPELKIALLTRIQKDLDAVNRLYQQYPDLNNRIASAKFSLSDPHQILEDLKQQMASDFPVLTDCTYDINYVPNHLEDCLSPAFYLTAPLDDPNRNVIYINNGYEDATSGLYTTLAHEGFPGHLYQTVYDRTNTSIHLLSLLGCSGANEGWATYVENYACTLDNGLPDGVGEYQALSRSFSLCVHGLMDIGINYDGWTKERAAKFVRTYYEIDDAAIDRLWQTMIDTPTNYLEYCGGYVEIMEMREQAEDTLDTEFSPIEFHRFLLDIGPVPFPVIRKYFDVWLSTQTAFVKN